MQRSQIFPECHCDFITEEILPIGYPKAIENKNKYGGNFYEICKRRLRLGL